MEPNKPPFDSKSPVSAILQQEKAASAVREQKAANDPQSLQNQLNPDHHENPKSLIKTYQSDIADAIKNQQASVAKIAIAEQERRQKRNTVPISPKKTFGIILTSIILIIIGVVAVPVVHFFLNYQKQAVPVVADKTIIPYDAKDSLDITLLNHEKFVDLLEQAPFHPINTGDLDFVAMTEMSTSTSQNPQPIKASISDFMLTIAPVMPPSLSRSFDGDYMYGVYKSADASSSPFLLLTTSDYDQTYAGMLHYEENILDDFGTLMNVESTTTPVFIDTIIQNKDARALVDGQGNIIFMYAFLDNHTLIITPSVDTFKEVFRRYVASQFVQ